MVLIIILVPITSVKAQSYTAEDTLLSSNVHDYFNNYFNGNKSYQYFGYACGDRTCYYGIDSDHNYVNITYTSTSGYGYDYVISTGVDENFSVSGSNVFKKEINDSRVILMALALITAIITIAAMNRGVDND
ncbi:MAG: hypothetical protein E7161_03310 [Firmicutes bacterium]|nr:hypothetical protein [Bacillota bacterium]